MRYIKQNNILRILQTNIRFPLESSGKPLGADAKEAVEFYTKYKEDARVQDEQSKKLQDVFRQKTDSLFLMNSKVLNLMLGKRNLCLSCQVQAK